jgi:hypothetical protein
VAAHGARLRIIGPSECIRLVGQFSVSHGVRDVRADRRTVRGWAGLCCAALCDSSGCPLHLESASNEKHVARSPALRAKGSRRCHKGVTHRWSADALNPLRYYHRIVGNGNQSETETVVCGGRGRQATDVSDVIEQKTKVGWRLHASEKLPNGRTRLIFRRPIVRRHRSTSALSPRPAVPCSPPPVSRVTDPKLREGWTGQRGPSLVGLLGTISPAPPPSSRAIFISSVLRFPTVYSYRQEQGRSRWRKRATRVSTCRRI